MDGCGRHRVVCLCICPFGKPVKYVKTAEKPLEDSLTRAQGTVYYMGVSYWRHLTNTTEWSVQRQRSYCWYHCCNNFIYLNSAISEQWTWVLQIFFCFACHSGPPKYHRRTVPFTASPGIFFHSYLSIFSPVFTSTSYLPWLPLVIHMKYKVVPTRIIFDWFIKMQCILKNVSFTHCDQLARKW